MASANLYHPGIRHDRYREYGHQHVPSIYGRLQTDYHQEKPFKLLPNEGNRGIRRGRDSWSDRQKYYQNLDQSDSFRSSASYRHFLGQDKVVPDYRNVRSNSNQLPDKVGQNRTSWSDRKKYYQNYKHDSSHGYLNESYVSDQQESTRNYSKSNVKQISHRGGYRHAKYEEHFRNHSTNRHFSTSYHSQQQEPPADTRLQIKQTSVSSNGKQQKEGKSGNAVKELKATRDTKIISETHKQKESAAPTKMISDQGKLTEAKTHAAKNISRKSSDGDKHGKVKSRNNQEDLQAKDVEMFKKGKSQKQTNETISTNKMSVKGESEKAEQTPTLKMPNDLSEEDARDALIQHATSTCCWGDEPAREMTFISCKPMSALNYTLQSFTESRRTYERYEVSYSRDAGPGYHSPLEDKWSVDCEPYSMFSNHQIKRRLNYRSECCHNCGGDGKVKCFNCGGKGTVKYTKTCKKCFGMGYRSNNQPCYYCNRQGHVKSRKRCSRCKGSGLRRCSTCKGSGNLLWHSVLICKFSTHTDEYVYYEEGKKIVPKKRMIKAGGKSLFSETQKLVNPLSNYAIDEINERSKKLVKKHQKKWPNKRILQQRHFLRSIPIFEMEYNWQNKSDKLWIYGDERAVYAPKYPSRCCWGAIPGCNIL